MSEPTPAQSFARLGIFLGICTVITTIAGMLIYASDAPKDPYEACTIVASEVLGNCMDQIDQDVVEIRCVETAQTMMLDCKELLKEGNADGG